MKEPKLADVKKYLHALLKMNKKYVTTDRLSRFVGQYPDVINETIEYFYPMIKMDPDYNLNELIPSMKAYVIKVEEEKNNNVKPQVTIRKRDVQQYDSIYDFVQRKMTNSGGLLDRNIRLSDADLKILKKLITEEQNKRKK
ncbi:MAG: hypothetical protein K5925_01220 [Bacilli bacterium]|nr:hypothetical protein [Bacilli bacterium]